MTVPDARRTARERFGPALLAFAGGAAAALANPPFGLLPGVFGYAAVLLALEAPARGRFWPAFRRGWAAGTGYLSVSTLWVCEPFLIDAAAHAWQIPFALLWCGAGIGLLWGLGGVLYRLLWGEGRGVGPGALLAFAAAFGAAEWLRGNLFTGFPWDVVGETFRAGSALSQGAALVGAYGLTPVVFAVGAAPAVLRGRGPGRMATLAVAVALVGGLGLWGEARLRAAPLPVADAPRVRVVQPDLPEPKAWSPGIFDARLDRYLTLTRAPHAGRPADLVVWPEGALPIPVSDLLAPSSAVPAALSGALRPGQRLVFGANRTASAGARTLYFNTLVAVAPTPGGVAVEATYDKHHLVPFGEYLPLRWLFDPLGFGKVLSVPGDFTAGPPPRPLRLGEIWVQPLICYEALFPDLAWGDGRRRAAVLLNISDDAWFGRWMGPWQHLNLASHRAIEEGLPMVRATPTGVSAVIDAYGRPGADLLAPGREGVIDAALPPPAPPTLYSRVRSLAFWLVELTATLGCLLLGLRARGANPLASPGAVA